jgi:protein-tyrosine-phosphatase
MKEKGIDISANKPNLLTTEMSNEADLIVTMGAVTKTSALVHFLSPQLTGGSKIQKASLLRRLGKSGIRSKTEFSL